MKKLILIFTLIFLISCSSDDAITTDGFEPISEKYPFYDLDPAVATNYWELNYVIANGGENNEEEIIVQKGTLCDQAEESVCVKEFQELQPEFGFASGCLPGLCYLYLKHQVDSQNQLVDSKDKLLEFLGAINTKEEALLWARANDYYFQVERIDAGAIKTTGSNFELIVLKTVSYCTPVQSNRYHLKIKPSGDIKILKEEVFSRDENSCV
ncbi:hypothetical protein SAMN05444483_103106 [Salegentibacter echinorum]|uniref:Fasciclin domain-containing protein n=1 Tax=Salegentibacter echinorum TaxID=1073325 RepID=A0A1M5FAT0_SALEC|nr:hypothetical protein [Salegentibacter echinorum]SHF88713.1 hypothetical protein SAMN05444483_103106 [Salegentibacter echinorum]